MKVLVLNCGSSSAKFQLFETNLEAIKGGTETCLAKGIVEKIGEETSSRRIECLGKPAFREVIPIPSHTEAIRLILEMLTHAEYGIMKDKNEIDAVGHRVVHGGETFTHSCLIDERVLAKIKEFIQLAPLHNPHNIRGYEIAKSLLSETPHVAVFDTAFHQTMPASSFIYALPYEYYEKKRIRRYGFHGTSHRYVARRVGRLFNLPKEAYNVITVHLGNGASIAAVQKGKVMDTSMGFTPLEGLVMGTRCGDIDPAILMYLIESDGADVVSLNRILNKQSGLIGISGISNDMRELEKASKEGNKRAALAIDIFCYRIRKYIGAYTVAMEGVDYVAFTAGIGENSVLVREKCSEGLEAFGAVIDKEKNRTMNGKEGVFSTDASKVKLCVIPTNEEILIAHDTVEAVSGLL